MPAIFRVDQAATFQAVAFNASAPKMAFQTQTQETAKDGTPKWEVQVTGMFTDSFGRTSTEVLKVGITSYKDPGEGLMPFTPVQIKDFEVGVMDKVKRLPDGSEKVLGSQVWYRASEIRPINPGKAA